MNYQDLLGDHGWPARFDQHVAGGRMIGLIPNMGLVVFTSIGVPVTTSWWIVPGTEDA